MAKKLPDMDQGGLGDISSILHNQSVSDLSWLAVDLEEYRAHEALPKQNLDSIPELTRALSVEDDVPHVIPLRPHVVVNQNPLGNSAQTSPVDMTAPIRNRVARLVMSGTPVRDIERSIRLEFAAGDIRLAAPAIREILSERGLLGNVYVDASHFPKAAHDQAERKLARSLSKHASFVVGGCGGCEGCDCPRTGICATFGGKRVVSEVPYSSKVAAAYAPRLASERRPIDLPASSETPEGWKVRIRSAFLKTPVFKNPDGIATVRTQYRPATPTVSQDDVRQFWERRFAAPGPSAPSPAYMKYAKRMTDGHDDTSLLLASGDPELSSLASQRGIIGHTYLDVDALGGCKAALGFLREQISSVKSVFAPDYMVRRSASCSICKDAEDGACAQLCRVSTMVREVPEIGLQELVSALSKAEAQGRISSSQSESALQKVASAPSTNWSYLTAQVNLYKPAAAPSQYSGHRQTPHTATRIPDVVQAEMDPEEVRRSVSALMNAGLSGKHLQASILQRYSRADLMQVPEVGRRAAADDGVQGHYFVDPTAYRDYGRGCDDGSSKLKKKDVPYVLASSSCTGCILQTHPGWCSKYAKEIIRQVPSHVREAAVAARRTLPVVYAPVENPVEKYELRNELSVDLSGSRSRSIPIGISKPSID